MAILNVFLQKLKEKFICSETKMLKCSKYAFTESNFQFETRPVSPKEMDFASENKALYFFRSKHY